MFALLFFESDARTIMLVSMEMVPTVIEEHVSKASLTRCTQHSFQFIDGYRAGLQGAELDYAMKKISA